MTFKLTTTDSHYFKYGKKISDTYPDIPETYNSYSDEIEYNRNNQPYKYVGRIVLKDLDELINLSKIVCAPLIISDDREIEIYDNYRE